MNVAMIYPAHVSVIEKTAALFGNLDVLMVSETHDANRGRIEKEGSELGFSTRWILLEEANLGSYDVLVDYWESRQWEPRWRELSWEIDVPRIIRVGWFSPGTISLEPRDREMFARSVVTTESMVAADQWVAAGVRDAYFLPWYPGDWYFEQEWTGEDARALFVLAGAYEWRGGPDRQPRLRDWLKLTESVPGFHLDAADRYRSSLELAGEMANFRCYVNLDCAASSRHLCLSFTEALAVGLPCLVIDRPEHDYRIHIRHGVSGYVCRDLADLMERAMALIEHYELAAWMSDATKALARKWFGREAVMEQWELAIATAQQARRRNW